MSDVASAAAALRAGRSEEALSLARMALRHSRADEDLAELARLAVDLDDPGLIAAVTVRRLRNRRSRAADRAATGAVFAIGFGWWLGWSLLVTLSTMADRSAAVALSVAAALLIMVGLEKGWLEADD